MLIHLAGNFAICTFRDYISGLICMSGWNLHAKDLDIRLCLLQHTYINVTQVEDEPQTAVQPADRATTTQ